MCDKNMMSLLHTYGVLVNPVYTFSITLSSLRDIKIKNKHYIRRFTFKTPIVKGSQFELK